MTKYSDLKLIDELLCDLKSAITKPGDLEPWRTVEEYSSVTRAAMRRLYDAYRAGRLLVITLGLARYFDEQTGAARQRRQTQEMLKKIPAGVHNLPHNRRL